MATFWGLFMPIASVPSLTLNNGVEMPILGFGVFQIPPEQTEQTVLDAQRHPSRRPFCHD